MRLHKALGTTTLCPQEQGLSAAAALPCHLAGGRAQANSYYSLSIATVAVAGDDAGARGAFMSTVIGSRAHDKGPACPHSTTHPIPPPPLTSILLTSHRTLPPRRPQPPRSLFPSQTCDQPFSCKADLTVAALLVGAIQQHCLILTPQPLVA